MAATSESEGSSVSSSETAFLSSSTTTTATTTIQSNIEGNNNNNNNDRKTLFSDDVVEHSYEYVSTSPKEETSVGISKTNTYTIRDEFGFPIEDQFVDAYHDYMSNKYGRRKEKIRNRWTEFKSGAGLVTPTTTNPTSNTNTGSLRHVDKTKIRNVPLDSNALILNKKKVKTLVIKGTLNDTRGPLWMNVSGAAKKKENANFNSETGNYYQEILKKCNLPKYGKRISYVEEIEKDIPRTFPEVTRFDSEAKDKLRRILSAYAKRNKSLGYCQSMNFLGAWALLFLDEEDAFWLLTTIVEDYVAGFYSKNMISIQIINRMMNELLKERLPELYNHFEEFYVSVPLITTKWFLTLFVGSLPSGTVAHIWDNFFVSGYEYLLKVALSVVKVYEEELIQTKNTTKICNILKEKPMGIFDYKQITKFTLKMNDITEDRIELMRIKCREEVSKELEDIRQRRTMAELSKLTHFSSREIESLRAQFRKIAAPKKSDKRKTLALDLVRFKKMFCYMFPRWKEDDPVISQIFRIFDKDSDNMLTFTDMMVGLSLLTQGTLEDRLEICFKTFDLNSSGSISKNQMLHMLQSVYNNFYSNTSDTGSRTRLSTFLEVCFANLDTDNDGKLTFEEFKQAVMLEPELFECFLFEPPNVSSDIVVQEETSMQSTKSFDSMVFPDFPDPDAPEPAPAWQPDTAVNSCPLCNISFVYPIKRKHHCRNCGKVVCSACSLKRNPIPKFGYYRPVRVCDICYQVFRDMQMEKKNKHLTTDLP